MASTRFVFSSPPQFLSNINTLLFVQGHLTVAQSTSSRRYGDFFSRHGLKVRLLPPPPFPFLETDSPSFCSSPCSPRTSPTSPFPSPSPSLGLPVRRRLRVKSRGFRSRPKERVLDGRSGGEEEMRVDGGAGCGGKARRGAMYPFPFLFLLLSSTSSAPLLLLLLASPLLEWRESSRCRSPLPSEPFSLSLLFLPPTLSLLPLSHSWTARP